MSILDMIFIPIHNKKIRRSIWSEGDYLLVYGWGYAGTEWAYDGIKSESPYGMLYIAKENKSKPFHIMPGHKATDWEIL